MNTMEPIKESVALERFCPHTSQTCVGRRCMAWVNDQRAPRTFVEIDWPANLPKPATDALARTLCEHDLSDPKAYAAWLRGRADEALQALVGGQHASTGRLVVAAAPVDMQLTKVRLALEAEHAGSCSLIR